MARLLFRLNNVPEDEAEEVRALLREHDIDFYETNAGRWGISVAALWLPDEFRLDEAHALIDAYQLERTARVRAARAAEGPGETLLTRFLHQPFTFLAYAIAIAVVLYFSLMPFFDLG